MRTDLELAEAQDKRRNSQGLPASRRVLNQIVPDLMVVRELVRSDVHDDLGDGAHLVRPRLEAVVLESVPQARRQVAVRRRGRHPLEESSLVHQRKCANKSDDQNREYDESKDQP